MSTESTTQKICQVAYVVIDDKGNETSGMLFTTCNLEDLENIESMLKIQHGHNVKVLASREAK